MTKVFHRHKAGGGHGGAGVGGGQGLQRSSALFQLNSSFCVSAWLGCALEYLVTVLDVSVKVPFRCVLVFFYHEDSSCMRLGPTIMTLFYLNHLFKDSVSKDSHSELLGVTTSMSKFTGDEEKHS